ncbi:hypothetical protein [Mucisphaera sp.]|uniref:hypothetical protein n=1 Tax=Mucisphaera sp. TaxID=2913024 RepID=UPI003D0B851E
MKATQTATLLAATLIAAPAFGQITFNQRAAIEVSAAGALVDSGNPFIGLVPVDPASYIGRPITMAWDGNRAFIAGIENAGRSAATANLGLTEVTNAGSATGLTAGTFSAPFGKAQASAFLGFNDLDIQGDRLLAAFEPVGLSTPSFSIWDISAGTPTQVGSGSDEQAGRGVAFDPGFQGQGAGAAWLSFGSGFALGRGLHDPVTGDLIDTLVDGVVQAGNQDPAQFPGDPPITDPGDVFETNREMDFGPNGDIYIRHNNFLDRGVRDSAGTVSSVSRIDLNEPQGDFFVGQNLEYMVFGDEADISDDVIIYNSRYRDPNGANEFVPLPLGFDDAVKAVDPSGNEVDITFNFLVDGGAGDLTPGVQDPIYDFAYDPATQSLAILEFGRGILHIFDLDTGNNGIEGDYDGSGTLDAADIDLLAAAIRGASSDLTFDTDGSGTIDADDLTEWVTVLAGTFFGDANLDAAVDLIDLSALATNFGNTAGWAGGNFNTDTTVDLIDLSLLATNFGSTAAIPEPAAISLLALGTLALGRRR